MKFILAEKKEMTQKFKPDGTVVPVTRVVAGPCVVTQIKTEKNDGYTSVQVGFGSKKKLNKPTKGHVKDLGNFRYLKEFRVDSAQAQNLSVGTKFDATTFLPGDIIKVTGISKGMGFQGVVKRHGFHGSPATHGHKDQHRMPGSIGAGGVQHVFKGKRMGGRMGGEQVSISNLEVIEVNSSGNEIFVKGGIPGHRDGLVLLAGEGELILPKVEEVVEAEAEAKEEEKVEQKDEAPTEQTPAEETKPADEASAS